MFSSQHRSPSAFIHTLPLPLPSLYLLAVHAGAQRILSATDETAFYTVAYGTGKGDVVVSETPSFDKLLPVNISNLQVRALSGRGFVNAESVIRNAPAFPRGAPLQHLVESGGATDTTFTKLRQVVLEESQAPVIHFLPNVGWDVHPLFERVSGAQRHAIDDVRQPIDGADALLSTAKLHQAELEDGDKRALALVDGAFTSLPKHPTLVDQKAFWALAPLSCGEDEADMDVVRGYVIQKTLKATGRTVIFVEPSLDSWKATNVTDDAGNAIDHGTVESVLEVLDRLKVPAGIATEDAFLWLARMLAERGLVSWCGVRAADEFVTELRAADLPDGKRTEIADVKHERSSLASTGVCVTGQMRSAPYTAANLMNRLRTGVGRFETLIVTERDDRGGSARLFDPVKVGWSRLPGRHDEWIEHLLNSTVLHETMSTRTHLHNYLRQLADMRDCLTLVQEREQERGQLFDHLVRVRPDTMLMNPIDSEWWEGKGVVVHSKRQSFYAMNDRFFAGDRELMGRLLSCHDAFWWLVGNGRVYHRKAGDATHMLWKKMINSERFLARCASIKRVPLKAIGEIDARRVAYSRGVATWREFYKRPS